MNPKFNRNLRLGYVFSIVMLLVVGLASYLTVDSMLRSNTAVAHSNKIIQKLERAISLMKDAETGQRGYLLTGKKAFLEPYQGAPAAALVQIDEALILTKNNPVQQANIGDVRNVLKQRLNVLQSMIEKKRSGVVIGENDLDNGKQAMDALRAATNKAEAEERVLLKRRTERFTFYTQFTPFVILIAIVLAIGIALYSYMHVVRDVEIKDTLQKELFLQEQETAALNEELTAANEEITAANEELVAINEELVEAREELQSMNESLELKVAERTRALQDSEEETQALNEELMAMNEEMAATNEELMATNEDLINAKGQLEKSERVFKTIARNIPGTLILLIGADERVIAAEGELVDRLGFSGQVGRFLKDIHTGERYATSGPLYQRMLAGEQFRVNLRGIDEVDYQVDFVPLHNDLDQIYAGLMIAQDITDIRSAEERSAKLAAIVDASDDAIIGKTLEGIITSWNPGAERMFGYGETDVIGQSILTLIPDDLQHEEPVILERMKGGERIERLETRRRTSDGRIIDVSLTISPIRDNAGVITGVSKIARDISEQKRDEQRKNDFIGMASHELKTPLTSLSAIIQVAQLKLKDSADPFLPQAMTKAVMQIRKMTGMINGFLNISRLESGKLQIDPQPFELNALIGEQIEEAQLTVASHQLIFEQGDALMVNADRDKIGSVISNLISNAVKYSPKGKNIFINATVSGSKVQFSVKDEGMGIKPQDMKQLFDRYFRVNSEHTRTISGFGIGLYLSAEIIQRHEGRIWADSEKGVGSTFYFTLPMA